MSISIATLGMFTPAIGISGGGGIIRVEEEGKKPFILVKSVYESDRDKKRFQQEFIIVKSVTNGE